MLIASLPPSSHFVQPGGHILVVDDEPDIAHLIQRYLEHAGYLVLLAHTAAIAGSSLRFPSGRIYDTHSSNSLGEPSWPLMDS